MNRWSKIAVLGVGIALVATTAARAASAGHQQPANPHTRLAAGAAVDTATESKYTTIAPCRIADTRLGAGALTSGHARSFYALGNTGFGAQGGAACDIPNSATSVTGSIIAVGASASGYLKVYAYGASLPTASFLNYSHTVTLSASGTIPVVSGVRNFTVLASGGSTQVVIQLTGYFIPPTWVEVASDGSYVRGSRVVSLSHLGTGSYQVDFDRDVSGCGYVATSYFYGYTMEVEPRSGDANAVYVGRRTTTGPRSIRTSISRSPARAATPGGAARTSDGPAADVGRVSSVDRRRGPRDGTAGAARSQWTRGDETQPAPQPPRR